jgi:hypothetical protein
MGKIIWLASYPRSGNTWLRSFLHNFLRNPDESYDINRLSDLTLVDSHARWFQQFDPRPAGELTKEEVAALRPKVHRAMTAAFPDSIFVKTHNALVEDRGTPMITLDCTAGAIYVVRNPLDVAVSYSDHYGVSLDDAVTAMSQPDTQSARNEGHFVYEFHGSWSLNVKSWTGRPHPGLHVVRYEDMTAAPLKSFGGIAAFLGLPPDRRRLERAIRHSSFRVLQEQERRHGFKERSLKSARFFRAGKVGEGHKRLSPPQIEALVAVHREQMARFGYCSPEGSLY